MMADSGGRTPDPARELLGAVKALPAQASKPLCWRIDFVIHDPHRIVIHNTFGIAMRDTLCIIQPMRTMNHSEIIMNWPGGMRVFADDMGVLFNTARGWRARNSIPDKYWIDLVEKARERRVYVSPEELMRSAAQRRAA